jgi:hypothetical protein
MNVEFPRMNLRPFLIASVLGLLAACASNPQPQIRHADRLPAGQAGQQASDADSGVSGIRKDVLEELGRDGPKPVIRRGSGAPINQAARQCAAAVAHQQRPGQLQLRGRVPARGGQGDPGRHARAELQHRPGRAGHGHRGHPATRWAPPER